MTKSLVLNPQRLRSMTVLLNDSCFIQGLIAMYANPGVYINTPNLYNIDLEFLSSGKGREVLESWVNAFNVPLGMLNDITYGIVNDSRLLNDAAIKEASESAQMLIDSLKKRLDKIQQSQ